MLRLRDEKTFFAPFRAFPFLKKRGRKVFCLWVFFLGRYLHVIMTFKQVITVYITSAKNSIPFRHQATRTTHRPPFRMRFIKLLKQWRLHIFLSRWKFMARNQKGKERTFFLCLFVTRLYLRCRKYFSSLVAKRILFFLPYVLLRKHEHDWLDVTMSARVGKHSNRTTARQKWRKAIEKCRQ